MMRVTPHQAFVAQVSARRGANDFAAPLGTLDAKAAWSGVRDRTVFKEHNYWIDRIKHDPQVTPAFALLQAGKLPEPFDAKAVAVAERIVPRGYDADASLTLVRVIAEARGVAEMVAVKLESTAITIVHNENHVTFDGPDPAPYDHSWDVARAIVCRSDDAAYEKARDLAAAWRAKRPAIARVAADFLFPNETAWAEADFDEILVLAKTDINALQRAQPLLAVIADEARVMAMIDAFAVGGWTYQLQGIMRKWACDVVVGLTPDGALRILDVLLEKGGRGSGKTELALVGQAMAALEGEDAAQRLAGLLLHPAIGPIAVAYFRRFPDLAKTALAKVASGTSKVADAARSILASQGKRDDAPLAEGEEIPKLLRDAPWRKKKKTKAVALGELPPLPKAKVEWPSDEDREAALTAQGYYASGDWMEMTPDLIKEWQQLDERQRSVDRWMRWGAGVRGNYTVPTDLGLREWNDNPHAMTYRGALHVLAVHGEAALPGLFARDAFGVTWNAEPLFDAQLHAVGPESARVAASALARRKAWRKRAQAWIAEHADVVARTLLPAALGKDGRERKEAEHAVCCAARSHRDVVLEAAKAFGAEAEKATRELVDRDPLTDLEVKGKLPAFVSTESLPPLKTKQGKRLPDEAVLALLEILRSTSVDFPYAGLEAIRNDLDEASLGDFAWGLVQAWILAGAKGTFEWIPLSLALIGDDSCARRLAPYVRDWARKDAKKAQMAVDVLAAMGTSAALLHLSHVADKSRFEEAKKHARETLDRVAAQQGITAEELADRTVPDLDLDKDGTCKLDFGSRTFTVTFDEGLVPVIKTEDGTRLPQFPRGTKTDDAAKVKIAAARFKGLKADAETVAQTLLRRFERAMCMGRTWRADAFRTYVLEHPLVTHLAKRLIWQTPKGAFRVADDGTLAGVNDAELLLEDDSVVSLPHPLVLGKDGVAAWSRIASDYAIVQPFEQLGRATYALEEGEVQSNKLARYEGKTSKAGPLMGSLESRGWQKWYDETSCSSAVKTLRKRGGAEVQVSVGFAPGIEINDIAHAPDQTFTALSLTGAASWAAVDAIDVSELVRDLEFMAH